MTSYRPGQQDLKLGLVLKELWEERKSAVIGHTAQSNNREIRAVQELAEKVGKETLEQSAFWLKACNEIPMESNDEELLEFYEEGGLKTSMERFELAALIHVFNLDDAIYFDYHGFTMKKITVVLKKQLFPYVEMWGIFIGTPEFEHFKIFCQNYMRNWLLSSENSEQQVAVDFLRNNYPVEFKQAVLYKCQPMFIKRLRQIYFKGKTETLGDILHRLWEGKTSMNREIYTSDEPNPTILEIYRMADLAQDARLEQSYAWGVATNAHAAKDNDALIVESLKQAYVDMYGIPTNELHSSFVTATEIHVLGLEQTVYFSTYNSSVENVKELIRQLFQLAYRWKIKIRTPEMETFKNFCKYYALIFLHLSSEKSVNQLKELSEPEASFRTSILSNCSDSRKVKANHILMAFETREIAKNREIKREKSRQSNNRKRSTATFSSSVPSSVTFKTERPHPEAIIQAEQPSSGDSIKAENMLDDTNYLHDTLCIVLKDMWEERRAQMAPKSETSTKPQLQQVLAVAQKVGLPTLEQSSSWIRAKGGNSVSTTDSDAIKYFRGVKIDHFILASMISVLQLEDVIYTDEHGHDIQDIAEVLEVEILSLVPVWKIFIGTAAFDIFRLFAKYYMLNWLWTTDQSKRSQFEEAVKKPSETELKHMVLYKCKSKFRRHIREVFFNEGPEKLGDILSEVWEKETETIRAILPLKIVNRAVQEIHRVSKFCGQEHLENSFSYWRIRGLNPDSNRDIVRVANFENMYRERFGDPEVDMLICYVMASQIRLLGLDGLVYYGIYSNPRTEINDMVDDLFRLAIRWQLQLETPEMNSFRYFCKRYMQLCLHHAGDIPKQDMLADLWEPANTFRPSVVEACSISRKAKAYQLLTTKTEKRPAAVSSSDDRTTKKPRREGDTRKFTKEKREFPVVPKREKDRNGGMSIKQESTRRSDPRKAAAAPSSSPPPSTLTDPKKAKKQPPAAAAEAPPQRIGDILQSAWKQIAQGERVILDGPVMDEDLILLSRISVLAETIFPSLSDWKEANGDNNTTDEMTNDQLVTILAEKYYSDYGRDIPRKQAVVDYCKLACKIQLLGLDRIVYSLTGKVFDRIVRPVEFLFMTMIEWELKKVPAFRGFARYYLYHVLRLEADNDLFDASWTRSIEFKHAIERGCPKERVGQVYCAIKVEDPTPKYAVDRSTGQHEILRLKGLTMLDRIKAICLGVADNPDLLIGAVDIQDIAENYLRFRSTNNSV